MDRTQETYKVAGASPTIKRPQPVASTDTYATGNLGVPRISLHDIRDETFVERCLSYLFGTEQYVELRRQLVLLRETLKNYASREQNRHIICSGSIGEGVAYPKSDDDLMLSQMNCRVVMTYREATRAGDLLMVLSEFCPGYCRLLDVKGSYPDYFVYTIHEMPFVSSTLWKQYFTGEGEHIHGPCQSRTIGYGEYDIAVCIPCCTWPDIANDWVIRERPYSWPSCETIQNIIHNGCHVVPIGDADSPYADHEWRISFSVAERTLMYSFNHAQFLVYNLLRLTLKRVIAEAFPEVLCSYFMKTTLFYTAENTPKQLWQMHNLESCFKVCLSVLYDYVDHIYCPNYFIPEYNMIKRKINHSNRHQILDIVRTVYRIGVVGIICLSGESACLDASLSAAIMEYKLDKEFMCSFHLRKSVGAINIFLNNLPHENIACGMLNLYKYWSVFMYNTTILESELIYIIWNKGINACCLKLMDQLFTSSEMNKQDYQLYKTLEALLRIGYRGDVTTGKLTMATYLYMVGKTDSALYVIRQLLSEYPPYAIDVNRNELKKQAYKDVMCGRGYTMNYKIRHAHAPPYRLYKGCLNAFPSPLKIWIGLMDNIPLDPLVYAYFLESLCHAQHQNVIRLMKSLRCLVNHLDYLKVYDDIVNTRMYVGIINLPPVFKGVNACTTYKHLLILTGQKAIHCKYDVIIGLKNKGGVLQQLQAAAPTTKPQNTQCKADEHRKRRIRDKERQRTTQKHQTKRTTHKPTRQMGNRCRLRTAICHGNSRRCGYPELRAHNPPTFPITQRSRRTYNCGVKQPPHRQMTTHKQDRKTQGPKQHR
ncbi:hypothetical protein FSP39_005812 [Pinctada imbricata]|uniref:Uncharacterized protein n=1 Tax=Pinctada imbricata TaxID=66713 RepID=A0AA89BVS9_PINIB|nr:hypothetical protein FSP39_005812 [Pinctada imbricata]